MGHGNGVIVKLR